MNLQVVSPHLAVSSFQIRIIANTARHIAYIANCNLSNFIVFLFLNAYKKVCLSDSFFTRHKTWFFDTVRTWFFDMIDQQGKLIANEATE